MRGTSCRGIGQILKRLSVGRPELRRTEPCSPCNREATVRVESFWRYEGRTLPARRRHFSDRRGRQPDSEAGSPGTRMCCWIEAINATVALHPSLCNIINSNCAPERCEICGDFPKRELAMYKLATFAVMLCALSISELALAADPAPGPSAPISSISTGAGQYFCIYHDRVYSAGATICVGPNWGSICNQGANRTSAAHWQPVSSVDACKNAQTAPQ